MLKKYIDLVKDRIQISDVIGKTIKLKKAGDRLVGCCPFHDEKTPSFSVNDRGGFFYCFGCGKSGDVIDFICETKNLTMADAVKELASTIGVKIEEQNPHDLRRTKIYEFLSSLSDWFVECLRNNKKATDYIESRLNKSTINEFKIGYCSKNVAEFLKSYDRNIIKDSGIVDKNGRCYFAGRIIIPIKDKRGKIIAFGSRTILDGFLPKYINSSETAFFKKSDVLYNLDRVISHKNASVLVVEGYMDVMALHQNGYQNVVGVLGTSITHTHLEALFSLSRDVEFCFDGDQAGLKAAERVLRIILSDFIGKVDCRIKFVFLPIGKDPDDVLKDSPAQFGEILSSAKSLSDTMFYICTFGKQFISPEDFIALERDLSSYLSYLKDNKIKKHFSDFFNQKIFSMKRQKSYSYNKSFNRSFKNHGEVQPYNASVSPINLSKLALEDKLLDKKVIFLKIVLSFPSILSESEFEEQFYLLDFADEAHRKLQTALIEFLNTDHPLTEQAIYDFISGKAELKKIYNDVISVFAGIPKDLDDARALWEKIRKKMLLEKLQEEYKSIIRDPNLNEEKLKISESILKRIKLGDI